MTGPSNPSGASTPELVLISRPRFSPPSPEDAAAGLICHGTFRHGFLLVSCVVRRTLAGEVVVTYPERRGGRGQLWRLVWPIDAKARRSFNAEVLVAAEREGWLR